MGAGPVGTPPLAVFAWDSGDPDWLLRLAHEGQLPTTARLLREGAFARVAGLDGVSPHALWSTLWSGVSLGRHGRYLRRTLIPGSYALGRAETPPPFWDRLGASGAPVAIVDAPDVGPVPGLAGAQLADWGCHPFERPPRALPETLLPELLRRFGRPIRTDERQVGAWWDRLVLPRILRRIERKGALFRHLLARGPVALAVLGFGDSHAAGHRFWRYATGEVDAGRRLGNAFRDVYRAIDREIGRSLAALPADCHVVMVSNSGFRPGGPTFGRTGALLEALGYHVRRKPRSRRLRRRRGRDDSVAPDTDWSRTTAFAIPSHYRGYIRVNLAGREPAGCVRPGADLEALLDRLEKDLGQLVDARTGECPVARAIRTRRLFGEAVHASLPDLFVEWRDGVGDADRFVHPAAVLGGDGSGRPRTNHHTPIGLLAARGPRLAVHGERCAASPLDLAPLCLSLLGVPGAEPPPDWPLHAS